MRKVAYIYLVGDPNYPKTRVRFRVASLHSGGKEFKPIGETLGSRSSAYIFARKCGFTHATGSGVPWSGIKKIPTKLAESKPRSGATY